MASEGQAQHSPDCVFREIQYHTIYICKIHLVFFPLRCLPIFQACGIDGTEGQFVAAPCRMILNSCFIANISNFFRLRQGKNDGKGERKSMGDRQELQDVLLILLKFELGKKGTAQFHRA